jgi:hypothetical protein
MQMPYRSAVRAVVYQLAEMILHWRSVRYYSVDVSAKAILIRADALRERRAAARGSGMTLLAEARRLSRDWPQIRPQRATLVMQSEGFRPPVFQCGEGHRGTTERHRDRRAKS